VVSDACDHGHAHRRSSSREALSRGFAIRDVWGEQSPLGRLWAKVTALAAERGRVPSVEFVCTVAAERFGTAGSCLVVTGATGVAKVRSASGALGGRIPEIEVTVGEGPIRDALELASPVLVGDLDAVHVLRRWPLFAPLAVEEGARACFAFPLAVGVVRSGVLVLLNGSPIVPEPAILREALLFADLLLAMMLGEQVAGGETVPGPAEDEFPLVGREVHQATGMVAVQLNTHPDIAFARLRARAFAEGRRLSEVAADVVARRTRFAPDTE
jgi:hypothetical protein